MATRGTEGRGGVGYSGGDGDRGDCDGDENREVYSIGGDRSNIPVLLEEGGGSDTCGLLIGTAGGRIHLPGGGNNLQGGRVLTRYQTGGSDVEDGDGNSQLPPHHLHLLPQFHPWFPGGSQHWDHLH